MESPRSRLRAFIEENFGEQHPDFVWALKNLAFLHQKLGEYQTAETLYSKALEAAKAAFGAEDVESGRVLYALGLLYHAVRDDQRAESYLDESLKILRSALDEGHQEVTEATLRLQEVRGGLTRRIQSNAYVDNEVADLSEVVNHLINKGRYEEALEPACRAVELAASRLGTEHRQTVASVNNLAELYKLQGRYEEAEPLYKRALAACERVMGRVLIFPQT